MPSPSDHRRISLLLAALQEGDEPRQECLDQLNSKTLAYTARKIIQNFNAFPAQTIPNLLSKCPPLHSSRLAELTLMAIDHHHMELAKWLSQNGSAKNYKMGKMVLAFFKCSNPDLDHARSLLQTSLQNASNAEQLFQLACQRNDIKTLEVLNVSQVQPSHILIRVLDAADKENQILLGYFKSKKPDILLLAAEGAIQSSCVQSSDWLSVLAPHLTTDQCAQLACMCIKKNKPIPKGLQMVLDRQAIEQSLVGLKFPKPNRKKI